MVITASAAFPAPGLASLLDQEPDDHERCHRVDPPGADEKLSEEPKHGHESHPQVMDSMASARMARLPSRSASASLRVASPYRLG